MLEKSVESSSQAQKNLRVDLVLGVKRWPRSRVGFETEGFVRQAKRDFASGEHSTWNRRLESGCINDV